jgi:polyisoprenoid-binding protein YceI
MKMLPGLIFLLFITTVANCQKLAFTDETSKVSFTTTFLAGRLEGTFREVKGTAVFDTTDLGRSFLNLSFSAATATTSDNQYGPDLIQPACFDPAKYPFIDLVSTRITKGTLPQHYNWQGQLKIKGRMKKIIIPFTASPNAGGYDFNFSFSFSRRPFALKCTGMGKDFRIAVRAYGKRQ